MQLVSDSTLIGTTINPFRIGYSHRYGPLEWRSPGEVTNAIMPTPSFSSLEIIRGCEYLPGDFNGDGVVNGIDVVYSIAFFKGGPNPPIRCDMCPLPMPFYGTGDVNGDCYFNGLDIIYLVVYLKGLRPELHFCPTCPPYQP
jgi:hypothetical protein